ncbi:beta-N-acetylhexosaminidase [Lacticaseibacillus yichunensis]|uniref:Family 20 glycosylhydrolase n=1 Tax=Lacticaseibacillus yichunensis TaxID=2486015 RepID=A0ABW4CN18_9LACO|nr:beta-N-acetylhexosaminidase [Lacticaseibacillus yichunensis]
MAVTWQGVPAQYRQALVQVIDGRDGGIDGQVQVAFQQTPGLAIERDGDQGMVTYHSEADLLRAATLWLGRAKTETAFTESQRARYDTVGVMIDVARNGVPTVATLESAFVRLASLGYNEVWLYLEDIFEVPGEPYFGLQRGRYSQADLHALAVFADGVGITLVPAIQTLAHNRGMLKWRAFDDIRDAPDCLYVEKPETTVFLRNLLKAASAPFLTKKIHIGMDEANSLGRGEMLNDRGLVDQTELMVAHLKTVVGLCDELGLQPMMWSDMWFKMASEQHRLYDPDTVFTKELVDSIPPVAQVYWDYYKDRVEPYAKLFDLHKDLKQELIFAAGVWTWNGMAPNQQTMLATLRAGMQAASDAGVKQVIATMWEDDGAEVPLEAAWFGLQTFAEYQYHDTVSYEEAAHAFSLMQGEDAASFMLFDRFDNLEHPDRPNLEMDDPSKIVLYEDLLLQRYQVNLAPFDISGWYAKLAADLRAAQTTPRSAAMFAQYALLADLLSKKSLALQAIATLPDAGVGTLPAVRAALETYRTALTTWIPVFRKQWHDERRGEGYEIMDLRLNGLLGRIDTVEYRLDEWAAGRDDLAELKEPKLPMDKYTSGQIGRGRYYQIFSASGIGQNM